MTTQANRLNGAFNRQDGERSALYENNVASTTEGQGRQGEEREKIDDARNAQRIEGTRSVCQAFAEKDPGIAKDVNEFREVIKDRPGLTQEQKDAKVDSYEAKQVASETEILHKGNFDAVRNEMTPAAPGPEVQTATPAPATPSPATPAAPAPQQPAPSLSSSFNSVA